MGLAEALLIVATGTPEEYGLVPFAVASYGLLGALVGACGWLALAVAASVLPSLQRLPILPAGAVFAFVPLAVVVGRYHLLQRVFREGLAFASAAGLAVHAALIVTVALLALALYRKLRPFAELRFASAGMVAGSFVLFLVSAVAASAFAPSAQQQQQRRPETTAGGRPNVILIVVDTLRADAVDVARADGDSGVGRIAADGVVFRQAHAQASWTRPSMASLFTSLYPSQHGAIHKTDLLDGAVTTIAEAFAAAGYWTAGIVTNINLAPIFNFQQGFAEYHYLAPNFYFGASDSATRLAIYKGLRLARELLFRHRIYFQNYYQDADVVGDAVDAWLASAPPQPFFLFVHYMDPHDPYFEMPYNGRGVARVAEQNPDPRRAAELRALYGQGVDYIDAELARLAALLDARGLYDSSIIALTSDHGEEFQEHGGWWHGTTLYQEQLHVPLVLKAPGLEPGTSDDRIVQLIDVAPTLLQAAGTAVPASFVGRNLLTGEDVPLVFAEEDHEGNRIVALRQGDWKIIVANPENPRGLEPVELYDLAQDPAERRNLASLHPDRVDAMTLALARKRTLLRHRP